ncbi:MAG: FtsX-like permease family protein [Erysipelothrix sp.]|nr:FtsX-like permease family protein [Erysipelothrix sp.]
MKKSLFKDIVRDIKNNIAQFISIIVILSLGVSFFIGIQVTGHYMRQVGNEYYEDLQLADLHVTTSLGMTDESISFLESHFPHAKIEPQTYHDVLFDYNDSHLVIRLYSTQGDLDQYVVKEGRDIESDNEIVVDDQLKEIYQYEIGDKIELIDDENYRLQSFEIVGFIQSVYYIDVNRGNTNLGDGSLDSFGYVNWSTLEEQDIYSVVAIQFDELPHDKSYHVDYESSLNDKITQLEQLSDDMAAHRYESILVEPTNEIKEAQETLDKEIEKAILELEDAQQEVKKSQQELDEGLLSFNQGVSSLYQEMNKTSQIRENPIETIRLLRQNVTSYQQDTQNQLTQGLSDVEAGLVELETQKAVLEENRIQLEEAKGAINQLLEGLSELNTGIEELKLLYDQQNLLNSILGDRTLEDNFQDLKAIHDSFSLDLELTQTSEDFQLVGDNLPVEVEALDDLENEFFLLNQREQLNQGIVLANTTLNEAMKQIALEANVSLDVNEDARITRENLNTTLDIPHQLEILTRSEQELNEGKELIESNEVMLKQTYLDLQDAQIEMNDGFIQMNQGVNQLEDGAINLRDGQTQLNEALETIEEGYIEVENNRKEAQEEIDEALSELNELDMPSTYLLERPDYVLSYQAFGDNSRRIENIGQVFPLFFFLIAALVSMTTIRRMVAEQVMLMGVYKALGYTKRDIQKKTMVFSYATLIFGLLLGVLLGYTFFPTIIYNAYRILYNLPDIKVSFVSQYFWLPFILSILSTVVVAFLNTYQVLQRSPAQLMRPQAPPAGKRVFLERVTFIWKRLTFLQKVTVRNIVRNKSRFFMSVIGIAGCTGLLVTGLGLNDSIMDIPKQQFMELQQYDALITYDPDVIDLDYLNKQLSDFGVKETSNAMSFRGRLENVDVTVSIFEDEESFESMYHLSSLDGRDLTLDDDGVILTKKAAALLDVSNGDVITLVNRDLDLNVSLKVNYVVEYYVEHGLFISETLAEKAGIDVENNSTFVIVEDSSKETIEDLRALVLENEGIYSVLNRYEILEISDQSTDSFYIVMVVIVAVAAILAFVVMYNLSSMNINERERELATLKVLGFYPKETGTYIFRESIILTLIGILVGIIFGIWLHRFVVLSAELDNFGFVREITPFAIIGSSILTIVFAYINELIMRRKINRIDMLSALKSVE